MKLMNYANYYYYPDKRLAKGLKKLIIFAENNKKRDIPNGSVFVYDNNTPYDSSILNTDVGCGITSVITSKIGFDKKSIKEILKAVDAIGMHIGQGNHFIDFTTEHPIINDKEKTNMIYLHSDFNNQNVLAKNYSQAKDLEKKATDTRIEYLEKLTKLLGISSELYKDWVHNSVNKENDSLVYRKGAINLKNTEKVGLLALNPIDGLLLYAGNFEDELYSAQHGLGRAGSKGELWRKLDKTKYGIARAYDTSLNTSKVNKAKDEVYNTIDNFIDNHVFDFSPIGFCCPELVVTTKKSNK